MSKMSSDFIPDFVLLYQKYRGLLQCGTETSPKNDFPHLMFASLEKSVSIIMPAFL